jgi:hypothetical protein
MNEAIRADEPGQITPQPNPTPTTLPADLETPRWRPIAQQENWTRFLIGAVYLLAFVAPISLEDSPYMTGHILFLWGAWLTVLFPFAFGQESGAWLLVVCWLANPLFWIGLGLIGSRLRSSRLLGGVFGVFAVLASLLWLWDVSLRRAVGPAYWLWCGSFVLLAIVGVVRGSRSSPLDLRE